MVCNLHLIVLLVYTAFVILTVTLEQLHSLANPHALFFSHLMDTLGRKPLVVSTFSYLQLAPIYTHVYDVQVEGCPMVPCSVSTTCLQSLPLVFSLYHLSSVPSYLGNSLNAWDYPSLIPRPTLFSVLRFALTSLTCPRKPNNHMQIIYQTDRSVCLSICISIHLPL